MGALACAVGACGRPEHDTSRARTVVPIVRFVDQPFDRPSDPLITSGFVTLGGTSRPVLSTVVSMAGGKKLGAGTALNEFQILADIPPALRAADEVLVTALLRDDYEERPQRIVRWNQRRDGPVVEIGRSKDPQEILRTHARVHALPDLASRDVTTAPVVIPERSVLAYGVGIEEPAWGEGPVAFVLSARVGADETVLDRRVLDPAAARDRAWQSVRIDLAALAGKEVRFRFAARPAGTPGQRSLPVWGDPTLLAPSTTPAPFNVLLVSLDTLRAASVGTYGCARDTTPFFDAELVRQGTTFERAIAPAPHTLASHLSLFTAVYPQTHGLRRPVGRLAATFPTLPEVLRRAGYETGAFTEDGFVIPEIGFQRGFASYTENKSPGIHMPAGFIGATFDSGIAWMQAHRDVPFFLFLHTYQVHEPYTPPPAYRQRFVTPAPLQGPPLEQLRYEQEVRYADDVLARLVGELDALGLGFRTVVVVTSDHGEEFFEHGAMRHGTQLYDEAVHVPLVIRHPGTVPAGRRVGTPVSLVDVAPTILDLLGLAPLAGAEGRSLTPLLWQGPDAAPDVPVFSDALVESSIAVAVRMASHSCIFREDAAPPECFDTTHDPAEDRPLELDPAPPWLGDVQAQALGYRARRAEAAAPGASPDIDAERERKLRALGYVQ